MSQLSSFSNSDIQFNSNDFSMVDTAGDLIGNEKFSQGFRQFKNGTSNGNTYIWNVLSIIGEDCTQTIYENVLNYIDNVSNIDLCKLKALKSMVDIVGVDYSFLEYLDNIPSEIVSLMDKLSINKKYLLDNKTFSTKYREFISSHIECSSTTLATPVSSYISLSTSILSNELSATNGSLSVDYTGKYVPYYSTLSDSYMTFITEQYKQLLSNYIYYRYADSEISINTKHMYIWQYICQELLHECDAKNYAYQQTTHDEDILRLKNYYGITEQFDSSTIVDNIENEDDSLSNYTDYEQKILSCEIEYRCESYLENDDSRLSNSIYSQITRYSYYRRQKVKEYFKYVNAQYSALLQSTIQKLATVDEYEIDANYFEISKDSSNYLIVDENTLDNSVIAAVAKILAKQTLAIVELRDTLKSQIQKTYLKGTFLLLSYIINEYLLNNIAVEYNNADMISCIRSNMANHTGVNLIQYYDLTEYYNIANLDKSHDMPLQTGSDKYWTGTGQTTQEIPLSEIENFYLNTLKNSATLTSNTELYSFLSSVFNYGAYTSFYDSNGTFVYRLSSTNEYTDEYLKKATILSTGYKTFEDFFAQNEKLLVNTIQTQLRMMKSNISSYVDQYYKEKYNISAIYNHLDTIIEQCSQFDAIIQSSNIDYSLEYISQLTTTYADKLSSTANSDLQKYQNLSTLVYTTNSTLETVKQQYYATIDSFNSQVDGTFFRNKVLIDDGHYDGDRLDAIQWIIDSIGSTTTFDDYHSEVLSKIQQCISRMQNIENEEIASIKSAYLEYGSTSTLDEQIAYKKDVLTQFSDSICKVVDCFNDISKQIASILGSVASGYSSPVQTESSSESTSETEASGGDDDSDSSDEESGSTSTSTTANTEYSIQYIPDQTYFDGDTSTTLYEKLDFYLIGNTSYTEEFPTAFSKSIEELVSQFSTSLIPYAQSTTQLYNSLVVPAFSEYSETLASKTIPSDYTKIEEYISEIQNVLNDVREIYNTCYQKYLTDKASYSARTEKDDACAQLVDSYTTSHYRYIQNAYAFQESLQKIYNSYIQNISTLNNQVTSYGIDAIDTSLYSQTSSTIVNQIQQKQEEISNTYYSAYDSIDVAYQNISSSTNAISSLAANAISSISEQLDIDYDWDDRHLTTDINVIQSSTNSIISTQIDISTSYIDDMKKYIAADDLNSFTRIDDYLSSKSIEYYSIYAQTSSEEYIQKKRIFDAYSGMNGKDVPYYNIKNQTYSSYQIHPYMFNFVTEANIASMVQNSFSQAISKDYEKELLDIGIDNIIGQNGNIINAGLYGLDDYSGYTSRYETTTHTNNHGSIDSVAGFDGLFYIPALSDYLNNTTDFINSVRNGTSKWYSSLNLSENDRTTLADKLSQYKDNIHKFIDNGNNNIFKYCTDSNGTAYILVKNATYTTDYSIAFTCGTLWLRYKDEPLAFPFSSQIDTTSKSTNQYVSKAIQNDEIYDIQLDSSKSVLLLRCHTAGGSTTYAQSQTIVCVPTKNYDSSNESTTYSLESLNINSLDNEETGNIDDISSDANDSFVGFIDVDGYAGQVEINIENGTLTPRIRIVRSDRGIVELDCNSVEIDSVKVNNILMSYANDKLSFAYIDSSMTANNSNIISYGKYQETQTSAEYSSKGSGFTSQTNFVCVVNFDYGGSKFQYSDTQYYNTNVDIGYIPFYRNGGNSYLDFSEQYGMKDLDRYPFQLFGSPGAETADDYSGYAVDEVVELTAIDNRRVTEEYVNTDYAYMTSKETNGSTLTFEIDANDFTRNSNSQYTIAIFQKTDTLKPIYLTTATTTSPSLENAPIRQQSIELVSVNGTTYKLNTSSTESYNCGKEITFSSNTTPSLITSGDTTKLTIMYTGGKIFPAGYFIAVVCNSSTDAKTKYDQYRITQNTDETEFRTVEDDNGAFNKLRSEMQNLSMGSSYTYTADTNIFNVNLDSINTCTLNSGLFYEYNPTSKSYQQNTISLASMKAFINESLKLKIAYRNAGGKIYFNVDSYNLAKSPYVSMKSIDIDSETYPEYSAANMGTSKYANTYIVNLGPGETKQLDIIAQYKKYYKDGKYVSQLVACTDIVLARYTVTNVSNDKPRIQITRL